MFLPVFVSIQNQNRTKLWLLLHRTLAFLFQIQIQLLPISQVINPIQCHYSINLKLDESNLLLWKSQALPVIRGHGLLSFRDDTTAPPTTIVIDISVAIVTNPCYNTWHRQDRLIVAWVLPSLGSSIISQAISCQTYIDLCLMLHRSYSARSLLNCIS